MTINILITIELIAILIYVIVLYICILINSSFNILVALIPYLCSIYCYCSLEPNEAEVTNIEDHANVIIIIINIYRAFTYTFLVLYHLKEEDYLDHNYLFVFYPIFTLILFTTYLNILVLMELWNFNSDYDEDFKKVGL